MEHRTNAEEVRRLLDLLSSSTDTHPEPGLGDTSDPLTAAAQEGVAAVEQADDAEEACAAADTHLQVPLFTPDAPDRRTLNAPESIPRVGGLDMSSGRKAPPQLAARVLTRRPDLQAELAALTVEGKPEAEEPQTESGGDEDVRRWRAGAEHPDGVLRRYMEECQGRWLIPDDLITHIRSGEAERWIYKYHQDLAEDRRTSLAYAEGTWGERSADPSIDRTSWVTPLRLDQSTDQHDAAALLNWWGEASTSAPHPAYTLCVDGCTIPVYGYALDLGMPSVAPPYVEEATHLQDPFLIRCVSCGRELLPTEFPVLHGLFSCTCRRCAEQAKEADRLSQIPVRYLSTGQLKWLDMYDAAIRTRWARHLVPISDRATALLLREGRAKAEDLQASKWSGSDRTIRRLRRVSAEDLCRGLDDLQADPLDDEVLVDDEDPSNIDMMYGG